MKKEYYYYNYKEVKLIYNMLKQDRIEQHIINRYPT